MKYAREYPWHRRMRQWCWWRETALIWWRQARFFVYLLRERGKR